MPFINRPALLARRAKAFRRMISIGSNVDLLRIASITRFRLHFSWARWNIALLWIACSFVRNRFIGRRMMYILGTLLIRWLFFALRPVDALMRIGHVSIHRLIASPGHCACFGSPRGYRPPTRYLDLRRTVGMVPEKTGSASERGKALDGSDLELFPRNALDDPGFARFPQEMR